MALLEFNLWTLRQYDIDNLVNMAYLSLLYYGKTYRNNLKSGCNPKYEYNHQSNSVCNAKIAQKVP